VIQGAVETSRALRFWAGVLLLLACTACAKSQGRNVYVASGCARCHGTDLAGGALGPSLKDLKTRWTRDDLVRFLESPAVYAAQDSRLKALKKRYPMPMPRFAMREETRRELVEFLLGQPD
jgi:mono/diheme cytochrome c family protein